MAQSGQYTDEERDILRNYASDVKAGRKTLAGAAEEVAERLDRNERGVRLYLGRMMGSGRRRRRTPGARRPRVKRLGRNAPVGQLGREIEKLAAYRHRRAAERDRLVAEVGDIDARLAEMRDMLLTRLGVASITEEYEYQE